MPTDIWYLTLLSIVQGVTEFLPISSSAHLILLPHIFGVPDQGLVVDMAAHLGSLIAVMLYFRKEMKQMFSGVLDMAMQRKNDSRLLVWQLIIATIPIVIVGGLFADTIAEELRDPRIIGVTSIVFGIVLYIADRRSSWLETITMKQAWIIGFAQILALIPGVSRSGITMTAGRSLGITRARAAAFSLLLSIPTTIAAILLVGKDIVTESVAVPIVTLLFVIIVTAIIAYVSIAFLMRLVSSFSFTPFVVYRIVLGVVVLFYFW